MVATGSPPPNDYWPETGALADELADYQGTATNVTAGGDQQQTTFTVLDHSIAFPYPKGDIMCASYTMTSSVTPMPGRPPIAQPENQSEWSDLLAPGVYSSLRKFGLHDMCFSVNTVASKQHSNVAPISFSGGVYKVSGVRAQMIHTSVPPLPVQA